MTLKQIVILAVAMLFVIMGSAFMARVLSKLIEKIQNKIGNNQKKK